MSKYNKMSYSEFTYKASTDTKDEFELILDYDEFQVYFISSTNQYFYIESSINDASTIFEVELIAELIYSTTHDLKIDHNRAGEILTPLFDCNCCCGEYVNDKNIKYLWFNIKKTEEN